MQVGSHRIATVQSQYPAPSGRDAGLDYHFPQSGARTVASPACNTDWPHLHTQTPSCSAQALSIILRSFKTSPFGIAKGKPIAFPTCRMLSWEAPGTSGWPFWLYWGCIGIMENEMETTILYSVIQG